MWPSLDLQSVIGHLLKVYLLGYVLDHLDSHRCHYSSQLGAGCGIAYNFYFKFRITSPLVYFIALAALPASIFYAVDRNPPLWVLASSSLLGVAFHFANVLKDLIADRDSNIGGLPQRVGKRVSILVIFILLIIVTAILINSPISSDLRSQYT
ncbi:MAG: UbiA family prenyltransferase [Actinomycetota bacterium]